MSIADQIAAEHRATSIVGCTCGPLPFGSYPHHVAEVTEAAVRAQVAAGIEALRGTDVAVNGRIAISRAADVARARGESR